MAWNPALSLNPEFVRSLRTTLPRRRALFVAGLTAALLAAGAWVLWSRSVPYQYSIDLDDPAREAKLHAQHLKNFGGTAYGLLTVLLFGLLFMLGPALAGLSFVQERLRGTSVFQQMTLLAPFRLAAGKFWGAGALAYFVALMLLPCALAAAWVGGMEPRQVARLYLFLLAGGFAWQAAGLYASAALCGPSERAVRGGLLAGPLVAVGGAVAALAFNRFFTADYEGMARWLADPSPLGLGEQYLYVEYQTYWWHFYGARVPAYAVVSGLLVFAGAWAFAGAVRRVKVWQLIPVGARVPWLFFATACALVVGLLWGRHVDDSGPAGRLQVYMILAWGAVAALAGGSALTRDRLREWWSADGEPLALLQRSEIKASAATLGVASVVSLAGLCALWVSYHRGAPASHSDYKLLSQFLPIALCFALTLLTTGAFVQLCAMHRFRVGGWAGVALLCVVYAFAGATGLMFDRLDNTAALLNPLAYAEVVTKGDYYVDSDFDSAPWGADEKEAQHRAGRYYGKVVLPNAYTPHPRPRYDAAAAALRGLAAESAFALLCLALAALKWQRTRREMLGDAEP
ncbi:MAG TPA: hypothetical protein VF736_12645 [Pyrinomonadaceae bacterium]|jgi:hypothetical protein